MSTEPNPDNRYQLLLQSMEALTANITTQREILAGFLGLYEGQIENLNAMKEAAKSLLPVPEIVRQDAEISFNPPTALTAGTGPVTLAATSTHTQTPVTFHSSNPAVAFVAFQNGQWQLTPLVAGTAQITAQQAGNDYYNAAPNVTYVLIVAAAPEVEPEPDPNPVATQDPVLRWVPPQLTLGQTAEIPVTASSPGAITVWALYPDRVGVAFTDGKWLLTGLSTLGSQLYAEIAESYPYKSVKMTTTIKVAAPPVEPDPEDPEPEPEEPTDPTEPEEPPVDPEVPPTEPATSLSDTVTLRVTLASSAAATARPAKLKYGKHAALCFQIDDNAGRSLATDVYAILSGGKASNGTTYPKLVSTDGCGNQVDYRMSIAMNILGSNNQDQIENYISGNVYRRVNQAEMIILHAAGWSFDNHGYEHGVASAISDGDVGRNIHRNTVAIYEKMLAHGNVHCRMRTTVTPGQDEGYYVSGRQLGYITTTTQTKRDEGPMVYEMPINLVDWTKKTYFNRWFQDSWLNTDGSIKTEYPDVVLDRLFNADTKYPAATAEYPRRVHIGTHGPNILGFAFFATRLNEQAGDKLLWCSQQEFCEYHETRDKATRSLSQAGSTLDITLDYSAISAHARWQDLSLWVEGNTIAAVEVLSGDADRVSFNAATGLLNVFRENKLMPDPRQDVLPPLITEALHQNGTNAFRLTFERNVVLTKDGFSVKIGATEFPVTSVWGSGKVWGLALQGAIPAEEPKISVYYRPQFGTAHEAGVPSRKVMSYIGKVLVRTTAAVEVPGGTTPTDPVEPLPDNGYASVAWLHNGATTTSRTTFKVRCDNATRPITVEVSELADFSVLKAAVTRTPDLNTDNVMSFPIAGLAANRKHYFRVVDIVPIKNGTFRTLAAKGEGFEVLAGSCAGSRDVSKISQSSIFRKMVEAYPNASQMLQMGDYHYKDINVADVQRWRDAYKGIYQSAHQGFFQDNISHQYVWDDHDFCGNDSDQSYLGRPYARQAYKEYISHYPFQYNIATNTAPDDGPKTQAIGQTWLNGSVRFIQIDSRSTRDKGVSLLGVAQKAWLKATLLAATEPLIILCLQVPWISSTSWTDMWGGYAVERKELADFFMAEANKKSGVRLNDRIAIIYGDSHMLAMDNGTNSQYAAGFSGVRGPICCNLAAIDAGASTKGGGTYSEGQIGSHHQFGRLVVTHAGGKIKLRVEGLYMAEGTGALEQRMWLEQEYHDITYDGTAPNPDPIEPTDPTPDPEPEPEPEEPTDPVTPVPEPGTVTALTAWVGAVTTTGATLKTKLSSNVSVQWQLSAHPDFSNPFIAATGTGDPAKDHVVTLKATGLTPNLRYYWRLLHSGKLVDSGSFRVYPSKGTGFEFLAASCAGKGASSRVSGAPILQQLPLQFPNAVSFIHMGDLHYKDFNQNDPSLWHGAYQECYEARAYKAMYNRWAIPYMWDDHDFANNNSDSRSTGAPATKIAYRNYVPHYPLQQNLATGAVPADDKDMAACQTWTMGAIRFILLDCRSKKVYTQDPNDPAKTMLGRQQMEWLKATLAAATEPAIALIMGSPWIMTPESDEQGDYKDTWGWYPEERNEIANFLMADSQKRNGVRLNDRCFILHGDAHMNAIDTGRNSQFATGYSGATHKGPPVFCFAALDASQSLKGGPFDIGRRTETRQFGRMIVSHANGRLKIRGVAMWMEHGTNVMHEIFEHTMDFPDQTYPTGTTPPPTDPDPDPEEPAPEPPQAGEFGYGVINPDHIFSLDSTNMKFEVFVDGKTDNNYELEGRGLVDPAPYCIPMPNLNATLTAVKVHDGAIVSGRDVEVYGVKRSDFLAGNWTLTFLGKVKLNKQNQWYTLPFPSTQLAFVVYLRGEGAMIQEIRFVGSYTPEPAIAFPAIPRYPLFHSYGINSHPWNTGGHLASEDDPRVIVYNSRYRYMGFNRGYTEWGLLEREEGDYRFAPTWAGGWNLDRGFERIKREGVGTIMCPLNQPNYIWQTWHHSDNSSRTGRNGEHAYMRYKGNMMDYGSREKFPADGTTNPAIFPYTSNEPTVYRDASNGLMYTWDGTDYVLKTTNDPNHYHSVYTQEDVDAGVKNAVLGKSKSVHNEKFIEDSHKVESYVEFARLAFQCAARYGRNTNINPALVKSPDGKVGLDLVIGVECGNENNAYWAGPRRYRSPFMYAAQLSAFYDGHKNTMGPGVGVKNADPNLDVYIGGIVSASPDFFIGMIYWCMMNRGFNPDGSVNICWDVIKYHQYTNTGGLDQHTSDANRHGLPTDQAPYVLEKLQKIQEMSWRLLGRYQRIDIGELGFDVGPTTQSVMSLPRAPMPETLTVTGDVVSWTTRDFPNDSAYEVWRKTPTTSWAKVGEVPDTASTFTDTTRESGVTYSYEIRMKRYYTTASLGIRNLATGYTRTRRQVIADWTVRTMVEYAFAGVHSLQFYMMEDAGDTGAKPDQKTARYFTPGLFERHEVSPERIPRINAWYAKQLSKKFRLFKVTARISENPRVYRLNDASRNAWCLWMPSITGEKGTYTLTTGLTTYYIYRFVDDAEDMTRETVTTTTGSITLQLTETPILVSTVAL